MNAYNQDKLNEAIARLGTSWVLHPQYIAPAHHATWHKHSFLLSALRLKAIQEGRLPA